MKVPMLDLLAQYEEIGKQIEKDVVDVLKSQQLVLGPVVRRFEEEMEEYLGIKHAIGVASGSDALLLALMALDVGPGCRVITTPFSFFATASSITRLGAVPVFLDIAPATFNLDPAAVERFLEDECEPGEGGATHKASGDVVKGIMPVHLFGQTADMKPLLALAGRYGLAIVEDAAQALSAAYGRDGEERPAGAIGEMGCFSFYPSKNLGGVGDGGLIATGDDDLDARLRRLRNHGDAGGYDHVEVGINSRLDALQAAALSVKLRWLDSWSRQRARNAKAYDELFAERGLTDTVATPVTEHDNRHIYNQYTIRVPRRDEVKAHLSDKGVGCAVYYPRPLHLQTCFRYLGYEENSLPESEKAASQCLSLPIFPELQYVMQRRVVDAIADFFDKG